jgi:hypothetical protein
MIGGNWLYSKDAQAAKLHGMGKVSLMTQHLERSIHAHS